MLNKGEVLVVDDDEDLLEMTSFALLRAGYGVAKAADGAAAVAQVRERAFDAVVLDMMMPGMDGVTALKEIKKLAPGAEVIMLTAHGSVDTAVESMRLGAFDYIKKPFGIDALEAVVAKAVERGRVNALLGAAFRSGGPDGLLDMIAASAARLLGADEALLAPAGDGQWTGTAAYGAGGRDLGRERAEFCERGMRLLAESGGAAFAAVPAADPRLRDIPGAAGVASALFMPLTENGRLFGVLYAGRLPGGLPFGEGDLRRAKNFAPVIALAVKNYELNGQLHSVRMQLAQAQKLESLGLVAGQVSHDFNNLLAVIIGSVQLLMENTNPGTGLKLSGEILRMAREAEALVKQLLSFARRNDAPAAPLDLNALVEDIRMILVKLPGKEVSVEFSLAAGLPPVKAKPDHIKQMVINLTANARNYSPPGGKVVLRTRAAAPGEGPRGAAPGGVVLEVEDSGPGINEEAFPRLFEPFFSSRPEGKGTGLGLHIARSAARECGGDVVAANRPEGGAVFRVYLPAA